MKKLCLLAALGLALFAQDRVRAPQPPNPIGQPLLNGHWQMKEDAFIHAPLLPEDAKYADLDGMKMKGYLREIIAISDKDRDSGAVFWGRNVGTPGHEAAEAWVESYFKKYGLKDIHRQSHDLRPQWIPKSYDIGFSSGGKTFKLQTARPEMNAASTPAGGLDLDLVWVGEGTEADFLGRDVKGKCALIQDIPTPGVINQSLTYDGSVARAFQKCARLPSGSYTASRIISRSGKEAAGGQDSASVTKTANRSAKCWAKVSPLRSTSNSMRKCAPT